MPYQKGIRFSSVILQTMKSLNIKQDGTKEQPYDMAGHMTPYKLYESTFQLPEKNNKVRAISSLLRTSLLRRQLQWGRQTS